MAQTREDILAGCWSVSPTPSKTSSRSPNLARVLSWSGFLSRKKVVQRPVHEVDPVIQAAGTASGDWAPCEAQIGRQSARLPQGNASMISSKTGECVNANALRHFQQLLS